MRRYVPFLLITILLLAFPGPAGAGQVHTPLGGPPFEVDASSVVLMDMATGDIIVEKNPGEPRAPASLIKILTLKVLWEAIDEGKLNLDDQVHVSEHAWRTGGSKMFIRVGTTVSLEQLLQGIIIASGNDACVAAAEHLAGSAEAFVTLMNQRASEMGLTGTKAVDPHGLSDENLTTARDIALLAHAYIAEHPEALKVHSTKEFTYEPPGERPITQQNRNQLLGTYEGADGLKTGYTQVAGFNLVATVQREGMRLLAVIMGVPGETIPEGEARRAQEAIKVLDYGFLNFETATPVRKGTPLGEVRVYKGRENQVRAVPARDVAVTILKGTDLEEKVVLNKSVEAPVEMGQELGELLITAGGEVRLRLPLVADRKVPRGGFFKVLFDSIRLLFSGIRVGQPSE